MNLAEILKTTGTPQKFTQTATVRVERVIKFTPTNAKERKAIRDGMYPEGFYAMMSLLRNDAVSPVRVADIRAICWVQDEKNPYMTITVYDKVVPEAIQP
jgi:soluble P-type ATPase